MDKLERTKKELKEAKQDKLHAIESVKAYMNIIKDDINKIYSCLETINKLQRGKDRI